MVLTFASGDEPLLLRVEVLRERGRDKNSSNASYQPIVTIVNRQRAGISGRERAGCITFGQKKETTIIKTGRGEHATRESEKERMENRSSKVCKRAVGNVGDAIRPRSRVVRVLNGINELLDFGEWDVMSIRDNIFVATEVSVRIGPRGGGPNARPKLTRDVSFLNGVVGGGGSRDSRAERGA